MEGITPLVLSLITVLGMFIANAALIIPLFLWNRAEARADIRHMEDRLESNRELVRAIHDETKDFHARLLEIEKTKNTG